MFVSEVKIENFRIFGEGPDCAVIHLRPGLTALVGENDAGKTAVVDALRFVLGTRDQEYMRVDETDFHQPPSGAKRAEQILVRCTLEGLTTEDRGAFAEHLTYKEGGGPADVALYVTWVAKRSGKEGTQRRYPSEWRSGKAGDGLSLDAEVRVLLAATYLRPLRDAERALSAGRGSRLAQILQHTKEITDQGEPFDGSAVPSDPSKLSVLGIGDYANYLLGRSKGVMNARAKLNQDYLSPLSFSGDRLDASISVSRSPDDATRLRQLLEKLEVGLGGESQLDDPQTRGLGSNNLLFMACELLLLESEREGLPLLLIEEPEAHLHPQRQLRLMSFLQSQVEKSNSGARRVQILVTTHSPNLASAIKLNNMVLVHGKRAFPMAQGKTKLSPSDYRFLERFLDVTKANLFFARAVVIVEGDAENILLPTLSRLLGRDLREHGVSLVNVGGVGLHRYARIFQRSDVQSDSEIAIPVACITDMDVMPDCAPVIVGKLGKTEALPPRTDRNWRVKGDFATDDDLAMRRKEIGGRAGGQRVRTFVSDEWTLEYDLALSGLCEEVWVAAHLASRDEQIDAGKTMLWREVRQARAAYRATKEMSPDAEELAAKTYTWFEKGRASKPVAAQFLAKILDKMFERRRLTREGFRGRRPNYLVDAIEYVTPGTDEGPGKGEIAGEGQDG